MVTVMLTATGSPFSVAGRYFQRRTASTAACRSTAGPESTFVATTSPAGLIEACTTTFPVIRDACAIEGYVGMTEEISTGDFTSPPTFTRTGGGSGAAILAADDIC